MKVLVSSVIALGALFSAVSVHAQNQSVALGYAQSKIRGSGTLHGASLKYRYEDEQNAPWGIMGSLTWMKGDDSFSFQDNNGKQSRDYNVTYYSALVGPALRLNDWMSLYADMGVAHTDVDKTSQNYFTNTSTSQSHAYTSFAWGLGFIFNPWENITLNVGYEGTDADTYGDRSINSTFDFGVGYRF